MPETIERIDLPSATRERYLRYALSVITSRALPDVRDGLKPVQRRILYAMESDLRVRADSRPVKSARVVGQVMSLYHPHSDAAIYDAMVRLSQAWAMRYPLVDGHGNFGAVTGDDAAAFRYTEARLMPLASELMTTLGEETVPVRDNYDGERTEPVVLPVPAPMLLLNGSTGIAVGMATNVPPHNLREVAKATASLIDRPETSIAQLLRSVKGPDFPTGGEVLTTRAELRKVYETGRGSVKLRGTYTVEEVKRKRSVRRNLVIDSIPYGATTAQVLAKIKDLVEGKKLPQVTHVSDQTTEEDGVRLVLELKGEDDPALIMAAIYRLTPLEQTYGVNLTCLLPTASGVGRPAQCDLRTILRSWLDFRFQVVTRSIEYRKRKLEERIHVLRGLSAVLGAVDEAIKRIRGAKDRKAARSALMKRFDLDEVQADAVLEIQLYRLAQLEVKKIEDELKTKEKEARRLGRLLEGDQPRWDLIKEELREFAERHGDRRRTAVQLGEEDEDHTFDPTLLIKREDTHVLVTTEGRIKRTKAIEDLAKVRVREDDRLLAVAQGSTVATCAFFTNMGSAYAVKVNDVPQTSGFGEPIQKHFNFKDGERVVGAASLDARLTPDEDDAAVVAVTARGNVVRTPLRPHREPSTRGGRRFARLAEGDAVVAAEVVVPSLRGDADLLVATSKGNALRVPLEDVPQLQGVGKGKRSIRLGKGELVVGATTRGELHLETTRGAEEVLAADGLERRALGAAGDTVKQRGGWRRTVPAPELVELEAEPEEDA